MPTSPRPDTPAVFGLPSVIALIVGNMIGTGVFTSLGFQVVGTQTGFALLALWFVGGLLSLMGALCYAELGAMLPRSGGEYVYLARAWSPALGFTGGFVSITAGFAAPMAIAAMAFGRYAAAVVAVPPLVATVAVIGVVAMVHWVHVHGARLFQVATSTVTIGVILVFAAVGLTIGPVEPLTFAPTEAAWREIAAAPFAISLIYVVYAYHGWNAVGYVAGEIREAQRVIPRAVVGAVLLVGVLYLLLHLVFLRTTPIAALAGTVEVAALSATRILGPAGGQLMSAMIAVVLVATVSGFLLAGSRVARAVAAGTRRLAWVGVRSADGVPRRALAVQVGIALFLIATSTFEAVVAYAGVVLNLMNLLAVLGVMRLRRIAPELPRPFRVPLYPFVPLGFTAISVWMIGFTVSQRPGVLLSAVGTLGLGIVLHRTAGTVE
ncbi:MAG: amino acid permease [Gemmatimonadetes bacterium]|nr:amino acid permease [Gemmatimonadota bacterium]